jgi:hypothetical protein
MKTILRRLHRLEEQFQPSIESPQDRYLRMRLEAARLRCGLPQPSPERLAELKGKSIAEILNSGRDKFSRVVKRPVTVL